MAPSHVRSKVRIAPFYQRSNVRQLALHMDVINAYFDPHREGSYLDFAPHKERDQILPKIAMLGTTLLHYCIAPLYSIPILQNSTTPSYLINLFH